MDTILLYLDLFGAAITAALIAGALCPLVGGLLLLRRAAFEGVALPQAAAAGTALGFAVLPWWVSTVGLGGLSIDEALDSPHALTGYLLGWAAVGTFVALVALFVSGRRAETQAARVAVLFAIASSATTLLAMASPLGGERIAALLRGEILTIDLHDLEVLGGVYLFVAAATLRARSLFVLVGFDPDLTRVLGHDTRRIEGTLLLLVGTTVAVGALLVGPVVLFGLLTIPPLAARGLARSLRSFYIWASGLGLGSSALGLAISFGLDWPLGPSVVVAAGGVLGVSRAALSLREGRF
ncbi:MAG: metal ABC transporter permease [Planctomycetota bacterium]|jgi:ABC-type Mn2+/Zn2+ transport system permease subunit